VPSLVDRALAGNDMLDITRSIANGNLASATMYHSGFDQEKTRREWQWANVL
jgi:hypothetical protein